MQIYDDYHTSRYFAAPNLLSIPPLTQALLCSHADRLAPPRHSSPARASPRRPVSRAPLVRRARLPRTTCPSSHPRAPPAAPSRPRAPRSPPSCKPVDPAVSGFSAKPPSPLCSSADPPPRHLRRDIPLASRSELVPASNRSDRTTQDLQSLARARRA